MCFCGGIWKSLCPLIVPSHAPDPQSIHTLKCACTCTHPHTHTGVKGKSIHSSLASCTLFHLVPNHEWSLHPGKDPKQGPTLSMKHTHQTHSNPILKNAFSVCSSCLPHLLKFFIWAMAWKSSSLWRSLWMCFFSEQLGWKAYSVWYRIEWPSCSLYSLQQLWRHNVLTHARIHTQSL